MLSGRVTTPATPVGPVESSETYVVQRGDTLGKIAKRFGVSFQNLAAQNSILNPNRIQIGQILTIGSSGAPSNPPEVNSPAPTPTSGTIYYVRPGDSLGGIAGRFGIDFQSLAAANNIVNPNMIYVGQRLVIPDSINVPTLVSDSETEGHGFVWPTESRQIVKGYQYGHGAIDIVLPVGSSIVSLADGKVEFAGWNNYGYGWLAVVDHGNGTRTLYAHNSELKVATGDRVTQGQSIAASGNTGNSSMPHLHLEIIINLRGVNPCLYVPGGC